MTQSRLECVDAGSEFCPCYLAETNNCITCSHLQGKDFCDCNWRGVCIYQEYVTNGYNSKMSRENIKAKIIEKVKLNNNCTIIKLKVTKTLARQLREPGAYVFLRNLDSKHYFDVPMSIMDTDDLEGYIYIAYKVVGTKTKKLDDCKDELLIRGPYWNGLFGVRYLKAMKNKNCLILARGIAQAPSILVAKKLIKNNNKVYMIIDKGSCGEVFIRDYIKDLNLNIVEEDLKSNRGMTYLRNFLRNEDIELIYSGGTDVLHHSILKIVDEINIDPYLVATNNNEFCCGEGVCGSCTKRLEDGRRVRTCKTQLDVREAIKGRVIID